MKTPTACAGERAIPEINVAFGGRRPTRNTVVFKLKKPNSRFHALLYGALERGLDDAQARLREGLPIRSNSISTSRSRSAPTFCTATTPNGKWFIWQVRDDWQRTTLGSLRPAGARYTSPTWNPGPPDKRVIVADEPRARHHSRHVGRRHVHRPAKQSKTSRRNGSRASRMRYTDLTLPSVIFNDQNPRCSRTATCAGRWRC